MLTPPLRSWSIGCRDAQAGAKFPEDISGQSFRHYVGELLTRRAVKDAELAESHALPDEEDVQLDMLGTPVVHWVAGEVDGRHIVAEDQRGGAEGRVEFTEQLPKPHALSNGVGHATVLSFSRRARHRGWRLDDQLTRASPRNTQNPEVERRVSGQPAQSASV